MIAESCSVVPASGTGETVSTTLTSGPARRRTASMMQPMFSTFSATLVVRMAGPEVKVVLTVSPVPLAGTTEHDSAITADCLSKSTLRVACEEAVAARRGEGVLYWPSFEIVRWLGAHFGPETPGPYGADDGNTRHVSEWLIDLIVALFVEFHAETAG